MRDLVWFFEKAKKAGIDPAEKVTFHWDDEDPHAGTEGLLFVGRSNTD